MLTVILLVVLGGGAGLAAVWMIDPGSLRRFTGRGGRRSLRAPRRPDTPPPVADEPGPAAALEVVTAPAVAPAPRTATPVPAVVPPSGPVRRRRRGDVPAAFTAVEGTYRDVAAVPLWRKVLSLVLLLLVLLAAGGAMAAVAAAVLGAAAELVNGAV